MIDACHRRFATGTPGRRNGGITVSHCNAGGAGAGRDGPRSGLAVRRGHVAGWQLFYIEAVVNARGTATAMAIGEAGRLNRSRPLAVNVMPVQHELACEVQRFSNPLDALAGQVRAGRICSRLSASHCAPLPRQRPPCGDRAIIVPLRLRGSLESSPISRCYRIALRTPVTRCYLAKSHSDS